MSVEVTLSFEEISQGRKVRLVELEGEKYISLLDFVAAMIKKEPNDAKHVIRAWKKWELDAITPFCKEHQFPGGGQRLGHVINLAGALIVMEFIHCENVFKHKAPARALLCRYLAGDQSLKKDIDKNLASEEIINEMARESMARENKRIREDEEPLDVQEHRIRVRNMNVDVMQKEEDIKDQQLKRIQMEQELKVKDVQHIQVVQQGYITTCPGGVLDSRARLRFQDMYLDILDIGNPRRITNGEEYREITISDVANELGIFLSTQDCQRVGIVLAKLYKKRYPDVEKIAKKPQHCDGATRRVNSYTTKDRDLMEQAIREITGMRK